MLSILLTILKILGIILLVILGIIVLFLLLLCVPIRYRAGGHKEEDISVDATVSWLLHLIHAKITYNGDNVIVNVKILGITVYPKKEKPKKTGKKKKSKKAKKTKTKKEPGSKEQSNKAETSAFIEDKKPLDNAYIAESAKINADKASDIINDKDDELERLLDEEFSDDDFDVSDYEKPKRRKNRHLNNEKKEDKEKVPLSDRWNSIKGRLKAVYDKYNEFKRILNDKKFRHTVKVLKKKVVQLFKHTLPRKLRGYIEFGFEDPSTTGYITAVLGAVYGMYGRSFNINPDFENKKFNLRGTLRGHIRFMTLILLVLNVVLRPDCRYTYKMIKKALGNEEGEE